MLRRIILLSGLALAAYSAPAQVNDPARFAIERDSLMSRAAAVRDLTNGRLGSFKTSFASWRGIRQKTTGYSFDKIKDFRGLELTASRIRRHIIKHKRSGAVVEKVFYYSLGGRPLLAEYYLNGQLNRLTLHEGYQLYDIERSTPSRTTEFVQGDYIRKSFRRGRFPQYFFMARPRP